MPRVSRGGGCGLLWLLVTALGLASVSYFQRTTQNGESSHRDPDLLPETPRDGRLRCAAGERLSAGLAFGVADGVAAVRERFERRNVSRTRDVDEGPAWRRHRIEVLAGAMRVAGRIANDGLGVNATSAAAIGELLPPSPMYRRYVPHTDDARSSPRSVTLATLCISKRQGHTKGCDTEAVCELNLMYLRICEVLPGDIRGGQHDVAMFRDASLGPYSLSLPACAAVVGAPRLASLLSRRCLESNYWRKFMEEVSGRSPTDHPFRAPLASVSRLDRIFHAQTLLGAANTSTHQEEDVAADEDDTTTAVPLAANLGSPRLCTTTARDQAPSSGVGSQPCAHHPIGFFVPRANIAHAVERRKLFAFLPYVPGHFVGQNAINSYTLSYEDEWLSFQLHRVSYYAWTNRRGGFDCMRHYEILAAGAIPFFVDYDVTPCNTMRQFPWRLVHLGMTLAGVGDALERNTEPSRRIGVEEYAGFREKEEFAAYFGRYRRQVSNRFWYRESKYVHFLRPGIVAFSRFNATAYFEIADALLEYTRRYLSAASAARYVLERMHGSSLDLANSQVFETVRRARSKPVLLIARVEFDYLHQTLEQGLAELRIPTVVWGHNISFAHQRDLSKTPWDNSEPSASRYRATHIAAHLADVRLNRLPGFGWFYGFRVDPRFSRHVPATEESHKAIQSGIANGEFSRVIYTYLYPEQQCDEYPFWDEVTTALTPEKRAFLSHTDDHQDPDKGSMSCCRHGTVFKRELRDVPCSG